MSHQNPDDWEASLRRRATHFEYPPTPDIAGAIRHRTHHVVRRRQRHVVLQRALVITALALLLLWPLAAPLRAAVARLWRIGAVEIMVATPVPFAPTALPITPVPFAPTAAPATTSAHTLRTERLPAGQTSLTEARERVPFAIKLPTYPDDLGPPDQVFVQGTTYTNLIMVWLEPGSERARLSLQVLNTDIVARKMLFADDQAQRTTVNGELAGWIDVPHVFEYEVPNGQRELREGRFVEGNVLIWPDGMLTYRLESTLTMEEARRVAESLR